MAIHLAVMSDEPICRTALFNGDQIDEEIWHGFSLKEITGLAKDALLEVGHHIDKAKKHGATLEWRPIRSDIQGVRAIKVSDCWRFGEIILQDQSETATLDVTTGAVPVREPGFRAL